MSPWGGFSSPNRLRSALLNGRCHAKPRSPTIHVLLPHFVPTTTSGRLLAKATTSSSFIARHVIGCPAAQLHPRHEPGGIGGLRVVARRGLRPLRSIDVHPLHAHRRVVIAREHHAEVRGDGRRER